MSSFYGQQLKLALFGQSHGEAVGITMDGFPAGMAIDFDRLAFDMARRAPGHSALTTARREGDEPEILSGVMNGVTTGQPLTAIIRNTNARSVDYGESLDLVRPGHGDYTGHVRYFGFEDWRGGGHGSARLTAPLVFAGSLCAQWLEKQGVHILAHIQQMGEIHDGSFLEDNEVDEASLKGSLLPVLHGENAPLMEAAILQAKMEQDSVGGVIECMITGLPAGLGAPFFDSVESQLAHLLFAIPAVKGVSFGAGFDFARMKGSQANDPWRMDGDRIVTETNHCGGVLGGVTNGMPVVFRCCVRATPSIGQVQRTVSLKAGENGEIAVRGRHDPCVLPRAVPVVESIAAICVMDMWKERQACLRG